MLDPWIIEEIRRREEEQRQRDEQRSRLEIQIETPSDPDRGGRGDGRRPGQPGQERGVTIIDFTI
jgi:hypothetical protein